MSLIQSFLGLSRITSRYPDDPRQPFWNETGAPMKPLAKLTINRQRYETSPNSLNPHI